MDISRRKFIQSSLAISMFLTPGLFILFDKLILPRFETQSNERESDTIEEKGTVIIAGIGRFCDTKENFYVQLHENQ